MEDPKILPASKAIPGRAYKRRVKNIVIHKPMQREFSFVLIALLMVSSLAIGFIIHHTINSALFGGGFRFGKVSPYEILSDVSYLLIIRVSCVLFVTLIVIALFGLLFLHRVAGPVYRFRQTFLKLNRGEVPPMINLREGDFFVETANEINRLIKRYEFDMDRSEKIKDGIQEILKSKLSGGAGDKVKALSELALAEYVEKNPPKKKKYAKS